MNDVWISIARIADELHPDRLNSIADQIRNLNGPEGLDGIRHSLVSNIGESLISGFIDAWKKTPSLTPVEIASALKAASRTANLIKDRTSTQLVWTGPETSIVPTRKTEQVMVEVINSAKGKLFVVSYVFYKAIASINAINSAIDRGVSVKILLESSEEQGGTVNIDGLNSMRAKVPGASLLIWNPQSRSEAGAKASVHAKCIVADGKNAFVTSANLTSAAMERNMEIGVMVSGGAVPQQLHSHLEALQNTKVLKQW